VVQELARSVAKRGPRPRKFAVVTKEPSYEISRCVLGGLDDDGDCRRVRRLAPIRGTKIAPVTLWQPGVGMAITHPSPRLLAGQALGQPRIGIRGVPSHTGFEPSHEVISAVDDAPSKLAIEGSVPAQA
jgi:hypothetical protein